MKRVQLNAEWTKQNTPAEIKSRRLISGRNKFELNHWGNLLGSSFPELLALPVLNASQFHAGIVGAKRPYKI
jgi:hypothetical protein